MDSYFDFNFLYLCLFMIIEYIAHITFTSGDCLATSITTLYFNGCVDECNLLLERGGCGGFDILLGWS